MHKKLSKIYIFHLRALDRMILGEKLIKQTNAGKIQVQGEIGISLQNLMLHYSRHLVFMGFTLAYVMLRVHDM